MFADKKVYYMAGVWDMFHIGHLNAIKAARKIADSNILIIGVVSDESAHEYKWEPIISYEQRAQIIEGLKYPDIVVEQKVQFCIKHMRELNVDEVLIGDDWKEKNPLHFQKMQEVIKVSFIPRTKGISSSLIKRRITK